MLVILGISICLYTLISVIIIFTIRDNSYFIASFWIGGLFNSDTGTFKDTNTVTELYNTALGHYMLIQFLEVVALLWAIHEQWTIENEYNISKELLIVTCIWAFSSQLLALLWSQHPFWAQWRVWDSSGGGYLTMNQVRWYVYWILSIRSLGCIYASTLKNIYDSFKADQLVLLPPSETVTDHFEHFLRNQLAFDYFYKYLHSTANKNQNEYRLLNLYIDLRSFEK